MNRGGRLVIGIGLALLGVGIGVMLRVQGWRLTEGELLAAFWPQWILVAALGVAAFALLRGVK